MSCREQRVPCYSAREKSGARWLPMILWKWRALRRVHFDVFTSPQRVGTGVRKPIGRQRGDAANILKHHKTAASLPPPPASSSVCPVISRILRLSASVSVQAKQKWERDGKRGQDPVFSLWCRLRYGNFAGISSAAACWPVCVSLAACCRIIPDVEMLLHLPAAFGCCR